nr:sigma-54-dependent Fis family transcriptional regulator [Desulfobacula sp.]
MAQRLTLLGFEAIKAPSGTTAIEIASKTKVDLAIVDLKMPDMDGLTTITRLKQMSPDLKTVLLTGYGSEKTRQKTEILGSDYFEKDSMGELWDLIRRLSSQSTDQPVSKGFVDSIGRSFGDLPKIIGETPGMQRLRKEIERLSGLDCTIILKGEEGTGKELVARAIHKLSHRKDQRFLAFNCGCFSNDFNFTELLGSLEEPGGAIGSKDQGLRDIRFIGTILLDHFDTMPEQTQSDMIKLLDKTGSTRSQDSGGEREIRFIVATHQDLKSRVEEKKFNRELYHRLNAISISVPPLRERRDDIFPLCSYFLTQLNKEFEKNIESISDEVNSVFMEYSFPGNVRELRHIIERAVILADTTTIELTHLPDRLRKNNPVYPSPTKSQAFTTIDEMERAHILRAIEITQGNRSKAAEILGISRAALWRKLKMFSAEE